MRKILKTAAIAGVFAASSFMITGKSDAAGGVTPTKDDCATAWAILMASHPIVHAGFAHRDYKEAIRSVIQWHRHWNQEITGGEKYEPILSQHFELLTFDTRFHEGGTAYVAHCGHGATCNEVARVVLKAYPEIPSPVVFCTIDPPHILENPAPF